MRLASWKSVLLGCAAAASLHEHQLKGLGGESINLQPRQTAGGTFPVTGIQNAGVGVRMEIRQMQQNPDMWNLYILGLARFMQTDRTDKLGYYQVAGIHGVPYIPWDGVGPASPNPDHGYCTHVSNLFCQWHRPYLALYEQALFQHIIAVVNNFPAGATRQRLAAVALQWRLPYLDWAAPPSDGGSVFPTAFTSQFVTVTLPSGPTTIRNPLFTYEFGSPPGADFVYDPFASWTNTKRDPPAWTSDAVSQNKLVAQTLDIARNSLMNRIYNLFAFYNNFTQFSSEAWMEGGNIANADSLESIHDVIHNSVGQDGHMSYLDYSSFDPFFWCHHAMMDRLFALWQALNPDSYVEPMRAVAPTFVINVGDVEDIDSPLWPFHMDTTGTPHTSRTVVSTTSFGYTYPELVNGSSQASIRAAINKLYGGNAASGGPVKKRSQAASEAASLEQVKSASAEIVGGKYRQYTANIVSPKMPVNGSFAIYFFLGDAGNDPKQWPLSRNLVGTHAVFAGLSRSATQGNLVPGANATRSMSMDTIKTAGTVPLTDGLLSKIDGGQLASMDDDTVSQYLSDNLHWQIALLDGSPMDPGEIEGLSITIFSAQVQPATSDDEFPSRSDVVPLTHITQGKPGGC